MDSKNDFIDNLIPDRFRITYEYKIKTKGIIITQVIVGVMLIFIGFFLGIIENDPVELYLNTGIGLFLLLMLFALRYFNHFENFINTVLTGGYIGLFTFILLSGGIYADEIFWLALLISVNINYTKTKHSFFWLTIVTLFVAFLIYLHHHKIQLPTDKVSLVEKTITLFSFFMLAVSITYSYSIVNKKKSMHHLEIIAKHKRLLKERDDLMSIITHDIKSPTRRIEGLISIFETDNLTSDQKDILSRLSNTAVESKELIDDLIEATSFQTSITLEKICINEVISELTSGFLPLASKKNIKLITLGLRRKYYIETSKHQLKRILDNLLSNAIKFSPMGKNIQITCVQNHSKLSISIADQGPGFNAKDELQMFKMFQKLSALPTGGESSTGLGLSIVKNLTELIEGEIKYVTRVGKGSTFTLVLHNEFPQKTKEAS